MNKHKQQHKQIHSLCDRKTLATYENRRTLRQNGYDSDII